MSRLIQFGLFFVEAFLLMTGQGWAVMSTSLAKAFYTVEQNVDASGRFFGSFSGANNAFGEFTCATIGSLWPAVEGSCAQDSLGFFFFGGRADCRSESLEYPIKVTLEDFVMCVPLPCYELDETTNLFLTRPDCSYTFSWTGTVVGGDGVNTGLTGVIEASDTVTSAAVEVDVGRAKIVNRATTISKVTLDVVFLSDEPARNAVVEVPARDSTVSGVGIISGWSCLGGDLKAEISDADGIIATFPLAHGISRGDTESECGDTLNGFSATMNWNLLRPAGEKTLRLIQNGEEVASHTFSVVAFEKEFITGSGTATVNDFPTAGRSVTLDWDESQQSFVITEIN